MFETDESLLSDRCRAALAALRRLSLTELHAIRIHHLGVIQREAGRAAIAAGIAKVRAEVAAGRPGVAVLSADVPHGLPDAVTGPADVPYVVDGLLAPERDEDGDEVLEPTPLVEVPAWPETGGPVS